MKHYITFILFSFCIITIPFSYAATSIEAHEKEIRKNSLVWNTTFITRDTTKVLPILSDDVQMATAGGKWQTPENTEKFLKSLFNRRPDITWVNKTKEITINPTWEVAYEIGDWKESWTEPDGKATIDGKYFALWKMKNDSWLLHAMIFTSLSCTGPSKYCQSNKEKRELNMKNTQIVFTQPDSDKIMQFEKDIAYFYGANNPEKISQHYIQAIQEFEQLGINTKEELLKRAMIDPLKKAYEEVQAQTSLKFDSNVAAQYEFELILAQAKEASFETIYQITNYLYNEVFQSNATAIHKGAMLRTFLYKYKISLLKKSNTLTEEDQNIMRAIAKESEQELNKITTKS